MRVGICTVALGGIYPQLVARMIQRFALKSPGYDITAWVNTTPPGTPETIVGGWDYTAYCAKPHALMNLYENGCDIGILLDAAFYAHRPITPLVDYISESGYYFCDNEFKVGEWCSDAAAEAMGVTRESLWSMEEISSYCVGLDFRRGECVRLLEQWKSATYNPNLFPGHHTAGEKGRNPGFVSTDPRVKGHRHDQTILSILAHQFGMHTKVKRPTFTGYTLRGWNRLAPNESTVLLNWGQLFDE